MCNMQRPSNVQYPMYNGDLLREVDAACEGVPCPAGDAAPPQPDQQGSGSSPSAGPHSGGPADEALAGGSAGTSLAAALKALMFAGDFTGVAETSEALQGTVDICHEWQDAAGAWRPT
jgi:hypothetical protein